MATTTAKKTAPAPAAPTAESLYAPIDDINQQIQAGVKKVVALMARRDALNAELASINKELEPYSDIAPTETKDGSVKTPRYKLTIADIPAMKKVIGDGELGYAVIAGKLKNVIGKEISHLNVRGFAKSQKDHFVINEKDKTVSVKK